MITNAARDIFNILDCKDVARIDFRLSDDNELHFIEINPLPGLAPGYSDLPMLAESNGISYDELVRVILNNALKRYGMDMEMLKANQAVQKVHRITSYNVCYTKLLREQVNKNLEEVFNYFPVLKERRKQQASTLSGGEQQMLAIGRALMTNPKLLILA